MKKAILIGVAGGTGSGKTSMARNIVQDFDPRDVVIIEQDSYYYDLSNIPLEARGHHNFDHPDAYDFPQLRADMRAILNGQQVKIPIYDYSTHTRSKTEFQIVTGQKIIVLEGIMVLYDPELRDMMDIKIYIETAPDIRFIRRLRRDIHQRGRTVDSVIAQYLETVRPMHEQFVEPTKQFADIIIPEGGHNTVAIDLFKTKVRSLLRQLND
ncbi:MAG TPA: uridine kinase [Candidatus Marinimicrobia bacterium]|nr:uridine kinase [Candidatus Neomarinimicrobiota bacterium]HRS51110.1 uridine kinase [Candidatus Neomarinimicrobiota bacterium]HRU92811.1 uridine kinase [Candidatus Neomarinimicrobiota bacterium]